MSDLFQEEVPFDFIRAVFGAMNTYDRHTYQVLTKRPERVVELTGCLPWAPHIWLGVSVENADYQHRIDLLRCTDAAVKFLSLEPLLGPLPRLDLTEIDWVIVGGESGPGTRLMHPMWPLDIRRQCQDAGVPFYFKQWGGSVKKKAGRLLDGREWNEMPLGVKTADECA